MKIKKIKTPKYENDSYLLKIKDFYLSKEKISNLIDNDKYLNIKYKKFKNKDISKIGFEDFIKERGSLRFFNNIENLCGSIYTYSVEERNGMLYNQIISTIKEILKNNPNSRKVALRIANSLGDYKKAEYGEIDVSCLNMIYFLKNKVNIVFRASDIKNELYYDIITIYWFFINPIYGDIPINLEIYSSTAQNVEFLNNLTEKLIKEI